MAFENVTFQKKKKMWLFIAAQYTLKVAEENLYQLYDICAHVETT